MAGSNKSSLNNLDQSKADNLLTNLGENINSASNKLITGDFSNATNDLKTLQDDYEELLNAIRSNNLYDVLGEKIENISNNLSELKNRTDQYLQSQEQSINKMLEALPQVVSKFRDIEERVKSVNNELGNQNGMQDFIVKVEDLKNKLNELIKLPLDDRSNVEQCAKEMAKIYVETIQSALETANIGKGLIVQAIKDDKIEIANELKKIVADTTMTINTMPNINPVETQNLNNTAMEVISVTVGAIDKLNNALEKAANIINNAEVNKSPQDDSDKLVKAITEANNDNIRRIYEVFKDLRPIDFESISYMSNEAQVGLNNQLLSTISNGSNNDINNINNLMGSYAKINESSSHGKISQDNVKRLAQEFIDEFERGMDLDKLSEIWGKAKSELVNIIIESRRIAEQITNGNDIRNSLNENIPGIDNIHKGLGYYNSNILYEINGQDNLNIAANAASETIIKYPNESQANKYNGLTDLTNEANNIFTQYAAMTSDMINNLNEINEKIKRMGGSTPPPENIPSLSSGDNFDEKSNLDTDQYKIRYDNAENFLKEMEKFDKDHGNSKIGVKIALNQSEKIYENFKTDRYNELDTLKANTEGYGEDYYKNLSEKLNDTYELYNKKDNLKNELSSKINEYRDSYKEFENNPTTEGLNDLNAKLDSIEQIIVELKNILDQIAGNLNSKDVQDTIGRNSFGEKLNLDVDQYKIRYDNIENFLKEIEKIDKGYRDSKIGIENALNQSETIYRGFKTGEHNELDTLKANAEGYGEDYYKNLSEKLSDTHKLYDKKDNLKDELSSKINEYRDSYREFENDPTIEGLNDLNAKSNSIEQIIVELKNVLDQIAVNLNFKDIQDAIGGNTISRNDFDKKSNLDTDQYKIIYDNAENFLKEMEKFDKNHGDSKIGVKIALNQSEKIYEGFQTDKHNELDTLKANTEDYYKNLNEKLNDTYELYDKKDNLKNELSSKINEYRDSYKEFENNSTAEGLNDLNAKSNSIEQTIIELKNVLNQIAINLISKDVQDIIGKNNFDEKLNLDTDQYKIRYDNAENFLKEMEKFDKDHRDSKIGVKIALNQSEKMYEGFKTDRYDELEALKANAEGHGEDYYKNLSEKLSDTYKLYDKKDNLKDELSSKINEYRDAYKEFENDPTAERLNGLNAKLDSIEQIMIELKNVLDQIAGNLNSKDVQDATGKNAIGGNTIDGNGSGGNGSGGNGSGGNGSGGNDFNEKPNLDADQHKRRYDNIENFLKEMEKFDKGYKDSKSGVESALNQSEKIYRGFKTGRYNELDILKANVSGHGEDYYKNLSEKLNDTNELYDKKDNLKNELLSKINEYRDKYEEFEDDPTVEGLNDLNAKSDSIEQIIIELKSVLDQIAGNLNSKDVQDAISGNAFDKKSQIGQESLKVQGDLVNSADNFNLASEVLQNSADMFDYRITSTAVKFGNKIVEAADSAGSKFGTKLLNNIKSIFKKMVGMDLSPMALAGQFATGSRSYYQKFGQMDIDTMRAMLQQGDFYSQDVLDFNRNKTIELYGKYNGQIDFGEFSKMTNNLISNIQGHVGQDKISGQTDMLNLSEPAILLNKVYGVDSENAINTFYKKIGMSAEETENHLYKLVQTAQSSNIPVSNYISTIATMSERFRELGVNINLANNGMQNLMLSGMSYEDSKDLVSGFGTAISNYDDNPGRAAFFGSMIGMDPFEAIYTTKARWEKDENGNYVVSESATKAIFDMMRQDIGLASAVASGAGEDYQKSIVIDKFKSLGMDDKTAYMAMDKFFEDDLEGLRKVLTDAENEDKTVILEGREELEEKLSLVADQTDALTTAQNQLNITNMELADVGEGIYELIGKSLTAIISTVGGILIDVVDLLKPVTKFLGGLLQKAVDNPITAILAAIATKLGIKGVASYLTGGKLGGAIGSATASAGSSAWAAIKAGSSKVPIIGGLVDGVVTAGDSYFGKGKTGTYSLGEGLGSGLGTAGGAAAGAAIGSAIFPVVGTVIGTGIGAWVGHKAGKKVAQVGMDAFDVQEYREGYGENISAYDKLTDGSLSMDDQYYSSTGNYDNDYSQLFYERTGITPDYKELEFDLDYDQLRLMEYDNTSKITGKLDEQMELQKGLSDKEYAALNSNIVNIKDVIAQNKTGQQLTSGQNSNALSIDTSLMFNLGKKEEGISTVHTSSSGASHGGAGRSFGEKEEEISTVHTSSSGASHGGSGRSFGEKEEGISTVHTSSSGILHGGSGRNFEISEEKGKDGNSLKESKKESISEETLARQQKAAAEVASTNYYEKYKQIQAGNNPLEEMEKESEKRREEQTQELISTISQKYSDLISSAQSEIDFLSIISDIDTNILTTLTEVKYILQNMKLIGSDDGKTTVHESSSGKTHGGAGKSFGDPDKEEGSYNNGYAKDTMTAATLKTQTSAKGKIGSGMSVAEDKYDEQILLAAEAAKVDPNMIKTLATQMTGMNNSKSGGMMGLDSVDLQAVIGNTSNKDLLKLGEMSEADALKALSNDPMLGALAGAEYVRLILNGSIGNQVGAMFGMKDGEVDNELTTQILMMMLKNDDYIYSNNAASLVGALKNGNIDDLNSYEKLYWNRAGEQYSDLTDIALGKNPLEDEMLPLKKSDFKSDNRGGYIRNGRTYTSSEVEQMILMSYGEIDENDFRSDNRGKFYLKGRSGEKDPRYTAAEVENIIKMSQNDDYSWLYSKGNIYNPDKETAESIAGVNGSSDNGSGSDSSSSSEATSGMDQGDKRYSGMMASPIYVMGSAEYSNQTTQYDPSKFRGYDPMGIKLSSGQGLARNIVTNPSKYSTQMSLAASNKEVAEKVKERFSALSDKYYSTVNSYDDGSSNTRTGTITNKTDQQFTININVGNTNATAYAKAVQEAITKVTKEYYDTSDINSDITFGIMNSDY